MKTYKPHVKHKYKPQNPPPVSMSGEMKIIWNAQIIILFVETELKFLSWKITYFMYFYVEIKK